MDFFKSVFSDSPPDSPKSPSTLPSDPQSSQTLISDTTNSPQSTTPKSPFSPFSTAVAGASSWSFGGLIQTLSTKSESVLETYRRDLQEFSTGLKNETQVLKHVAATSLDVGAAKAQVSLESVGLAIDSLGSAVSDIIFQSSNSSDQPSPPQPPPPSDVGVKYSRFESQLRAIQTDESTFVEDPVEEGEKAEFEKWKLGFDLGEHSAEIDELLGRGDAGVKGIYDRIVVPGVVDRELFWLRYFYRVHRLNQAELVRTRLVKRAIEADGDDEELTWDVDDEDIDDTENKKDDDVNVNVNVKESTDVNVKDSTDVNVKDKTDVNVPVKEEISSVAEAVMEKEEGNDNETVSVVTEGKGGEASESSKDSDISVVSRPASSHEEEDMGWDEIEDIGESGDDEKKGSTQLGSPSRAELRKRLSAAEDDDDLTWDIDEDDDEPIKR